MVAERVWHAATEIGLSVQPWTALLFLFLRLRESETELGQDTVKTLSDIRCLFRAVIPEAMAMTDVLLLRLAYASSPTARSLRRNVDDFLIFKD